MSNWLDSAIARAELVDDWLTPKREKSLALLRECRWPTRKTEAWKYTPVKAIERAALTLVVSDQAVVGSTEVPVGPVTAATLDFECIKIDLVDGELVADLSALTLPVGLSITSLAGAELNSSSWVKDSYAAIKPDRHLFGLVNDVLAEQGVVIDVAAGVSIELPIYIDNVLSKNCEAHTRVLVRIGEGAKVTIVEHFHGKELSLSTSFAEYDISEQAELEHYRFALQTGEAISLGGSHFQLGTKAKLNSTIVGFGSDLSRTDVDVSHVGEHAYAKLNALYLLDGEELFDLHSTIEHIAPNGTTEENVRGIVADKSRAVFNGRIHIHRDAQKTLADLNNRNLLLSDKAEINTKPELEIYADDVRCSHGATIAEIDKESLFYLQSRGISRASAQIMLSFGFINELVDQMPNELLAEWLRPQLRQRFSMMEVK
ncbi:MAG: Fe-S cluster assembly protein SufD [Oceanicoccus sp.]|jgi:Fe-S cluster assembly protein SufD